MLLEGERRSGVRLMDVHTRRLLALKYQCIFYFKLAANMVGGDVRKFVYDVTPDHVCY
jgi:hypothetical protein